MSESSTQTYGDERISYDGEGRAKLCYRGIIKSPKNSENEKEPLELTS